MGSEADEPRPFADAPITIIDVGARWGMAEHWEQLAHPWRAYGFDPDPDECRRLNAAAQESGERNTTYVPHALGATPGAARLHFTQDPACSSLYPPIREIAERLPECACQTPTDGSEIIQVMTLDTWCDDNGVARVDVIKLDTQGSELQVLQGAQKTLENVQLIEVEVEFNPMYEGQPLFGDVDAYLRARGFLLWRLDNLVHYSAGDASGEVASARLSYFDSVPFRSSAKGGQLFWGHAYYTRAELCPGNTRVPSRRQAERAAAVAEAAGLSDLAISARIAAGG